jgi:hypothetical protein
MVIFGAFAPRSKGFSDASEHRAASVCKLVYVCKVDVEIIRSKECVLHGNVVCVGRPACPCNSRTGNAIIEHRN